MHRLVCRGEAFLTVCIPQEASIDFYWAEFSAQISYRHIAFSPLAPLFPFVSDPAFSKINVTSSVLASVGEGEGQQVEHKHTCLPHPVCLPSWGCRAEGPISGPSEPCNQRCQTQLPVELTGWHSKRIRQAGQSPAAAWGKHGACQTAASLSWGSARLDRPGALRLVGLSQVTRGHRTSMMARWERRPCSVPLNWEFWHIVVPCQTSTFYISVTIFTLLSFNAVQGWNRSYAWRAFSEPVILLCISVAVIKVLTI